MTLTSEEINSRFVTAVDGAVPTDNQRQASALIKSLILDVAHTLNSVAPDSRTKSLALTALEEALMWANKSIFNPPKEQD